MRTKYFNFLLFIVICLQAKSQVYVNVCVNQPPPLTLSQGVIINETCLNSFNGSATVTASGGKAPYFYSWNTTPIQYTQTATGLAAGNYTATVRDADSCINTIDVIVARNPNPIAVFNNTTVCNTSATQFTDSSTTTSGTITSWTWDFGDGSTFDTTPTPSHLYTNAGNYTATLIVNNSFGCADTVVQPVQVYFNPIAGFTHNDVCFGDSIHFTNTSSVTSPASITSYLWAFGSSTSYFENPVYYYTTPGIDTVTLLATTSDGCSSVITASVKTFALPVSSFTFSNSCLFEPTVFTNTTANPLMDTVGSWSWNFGDGSPLNTNVWNPQHVYAAAGNYQVTLITRTSILGCSDTLQTTISVSPKPVAKYGFVNVCLNQPMNFTDSSSVAGGSISNWSWNFGDATPLGTLQDDSHTYTAFGTYPVSLIVTTNNGCKDTVAKNVIVHPLPTAQFTKINVCSGTPVSFTDGSHIPATDTIEFWKWNFGDGSPVDTNENTSHLYTTSGSYSTQLWIASTFGCVDSITHTCIVNPNPVANFTADTKMGCEPLCVNFTDSSFVPPGNNVHWLWDLGDGTTSNLQNTNHCYTNDSVFVPVFFSVALKVTSDSGCVSNITKNNYITVYPKPIADFIVQPKTASIIDPVISITDVSTGTHFWNWDFGNQDTTSLHAPPPHKYADTGAYTITLITSSLYDCKDTAYQEIVIEPDFLFYIPNSFSPNDDGVNDTFSGKGVFIKEYEMKIFDRWGNLIFITNDINKGWEGKINNGIEIAKQDIYVYSIKINDYNGKEHSFKGIVTLVL